MITKETEVGHLSAVGGISSRVVVGEADMEVMVEVGVVIGAKIGDSSNSNNSNNTDIMTIPQFQTLKDIFGIYYCALFSFLIAITIIFNLFLVLFFSISFAFYT